MKIKFSLVKIRDQVYLLKFEDNFDMSMAFLRYQEQSYKSGRPSTLVDIISRYIKEHDSEEGVFTYPKDWLGFALSIESIEKAHRLKISDKNSYDELMINVCKRIRKECKRKPAYVISIKNCEFKRSSLRHELVHTLYYIDEEYERECNKLFKNLSKKFWCEVIKPLTQRYQINKFVIVNELQAYLTTGEGGLFDNIKDQNKMDQLRFAIRTLYRKHIKLFLNGKDADDFL